MTGEVEIAHEFWEVNGIRMHLALSGTGPPIILLHGFPEFWYSWRYLIPRLAQGFRVIAPDLRGYGQTEVPARGYDLDTLARDVADLVDRAGGRAVLVGHDWGGVIGWHVAASYPEKVEAWVSVAGPHPARYLELQRSNLRQLVMSLYTLFFQVPFIPEWLMSRRRGLVLARVMRRSAGRPGMFSDLDLEPYRNEWSRQEALRAGINYYRQFARALFRIPRFYRDHKVLCPVCVVWGDRDPFLSLAQTEGLEKWCQSPPRVNVIPGCGHWIAQEKPAELHRIIMEFAG
jgi:pimeloyl-ACP methyl ester carboxylesterase